MRKVLKRREKKYLKYLVNGSKDTKGFYIQRETHCIDPFRLLACIIFYLRYRLITFLLLVYRIQLCRNRAPFEQCYNCCMSFSLNIAGLFVTVIDLIPEKCTVWNWEILCKTKQHLFYSGMIWQQKSWSNKWVG